MANTESGKFDTNTYLSLKECGPMLENYTATDPRFKYKSDAARHLIKLGIKSDKKEREKAIKAAANSIP